uniref:CCHC-type domain-containing protein n=1 Tax=Nothobranchius furzeri TaxID=105023 RepID=A0A1A7ZVK1_NOTFU
MTYVKSKADDATGLLSGSNFSVGRGRMIEGLHFTPVRNTTVAGSPAFCSTRMVEDAATSYGQNSGVSHSSPSVDPPLNDLITSIAQQVGQSIMDQLKGGCGERGTMGLQPRDNVDQPSGEPTYLNLTGAKLVIQPDVKEPPLFRGDGSDKYTIHEWEDMMNAYFRKRDTPVHEQYPEIVSKLMGRAKDIVRITLRNSLSLKPQEKPDVIYSILRQHFSDVPYSCMPMADFYNTVPVVGETPLDYWVRLNKAVDVAEEALKRLGRHIDNPCQEAAMMFVKHCPDPALAAILKFKAPDRWTAGEIQEHVDRYQMEAREQVFSRSKYTKLAAVHAQAPYPEPLPSGSHPSDVQTQQEAGAAVQQHCNDSCMKTLISLFERTLTQNSQIADRQILPGQAQHRACRVCQSRDHSTVTHCRQKRLCLACFEPNHIKRDCPNRFGAKGEHASPSQDPQHLN